MNQENLVPGSWRLHLILTASVMFTLSLALLLAQLDSLQRQILPSPVAQAISNLKATPTSTPLPAIPMATGTPTPPASSTPTLSNSDTAVAILPTCSATPPDWVLTAVAPDETLLSLSLGYNISQEKIRLANCLEPGPLADVSALYLPGAAATPVPLADCGPPPDWEFYTVQPGDNMFRLSLRYGTTINAILKANCLTSTNIQAGQRLYLPPGVVAPPLPSATAAATGTPTGTATTTVTATPTATGTPTSTVPPLPTSTLTATSTVTVTATGTPTASSTPTVTTTPDASPTSTPTASATPSNTPSPTSTATPTASATPPPTNSPTPSSTPDDTATPTATATETAVP